MKKFNAMIFLALLGIFQGSTLHAALLVSSSFSDGVGTNVTPSGWGGSGDDAITAGSLTAPAELAPSTGNKFTLDGDDNSDYTLSFAATGSSTGATLYYSFLFKVDDLTGLTPDSSNRSVFSLGTGGKSGGTFSIAVDEDKASAYNVGLDGSNKGIATAVRDTVEYTTADTLFVVVEYIPRGAHAGDARMWVNPDSASFGGAAPLTATLTDAGGYLTDATALYLDTQYNHPAVWSVDEVRVGTSYASVTPIPEPGTLAFVFMGSLAVMISLRRRG
ncbi:hypothetical protein P0Y35_13605 [Kiritimatiellaeota bacterium B1221]|nr:hypothetical protein [Kiritimatiellaeota bacterium B1221]